MKELNPSQKVLLDTVGLTDEAISAMLFNLVDDAIRDLGEDPNGEVANRMYKLVQDAWDLRSLLDKEGFIA